MNAKAIFGALLAAGLVWLALRKKTPEGSATFGPLVHGPAGPALDDAGLHTPAPENIGPGGLEPADNPRYDSLTGFTEAEEWAAVNRYRFPIPQLTGR